MSERKHRRPQEDIAQPEVEETKIMLEPAKVELGSAYTLTMSHDENDEPVVNVKTFGNVNLTQLRRAITLAFPGAQIRQANQRRTVTVAKTTKKKRPASGKRSP
jgi:hypothetical protein